MRKAEFPFQSTPCESSEAFPGRKEYVFPVVPCRLHHGKCSLPPIDFLVDSGADHCVFGGDIAEALGIDIRAGVRHSLTGVVGRKGESWVHSVKLEVVGLEKYQLRCAFVECEIPHSGLLGRLGFFDRYVVTVDLRKRVTTISR